MRGKKEPAGFTLLELMVVLAVAGILVAIAAPSFQSFMRSGNIVSARDGLCNAIKMARSEALYRKTSVTICASSSQTGCAGTEWGTGWVIFTDENANESVDGDDELVNARYGFDGKVRTGTDASNGRMTFSANGILTPVGANGSISICDSDEDSALSGQALQVSAVGRVICTADPTC